MCHVLFSWVLSFPLFFPMTEHAFNHGLSLCNRSADWRKSECVSVTYRSIWGLLEWHWKRSKWLTKKNKKKQQCRHKDMNQLLSVTGINYKQIYYLFILQLGVLLLLLSLHTHTCFSVFFEECPECLIQIYTSKDV